MLTKKIIEINVDIFENKVKNENIDILNHHYFSNIGINVLSNNDINMIISQSSKLLEDLKILPPSFQNLDIEILYTLMNMLYNKDLLEKSWAEKLLLFLEIRYKDLKTHINKKFPNDSDKKYFLAVLTSYIVEHGFIYNDLR